MVTNFIGMKRQPVRDNVSSGSEFNGTIPAARFLLIVCYLFCDIYIYTHRHIEKTEPKNIFTGKAHSSL
jgi:hypothetical protein